MKQLLVNEWSGILEQDKKEVREQLKNQPEVIEVDLSDGSE